MYKTLIDKLSSQHVNNRSTTVPLQDMIKSKTELLTLIIPRSTETRDNLLILSWANSETILSERKIITITTTTPCKVTLNLKWIMSKLTIGPRLPAIK